MIDRRERQVREELKVEALRLYGQGVHSPEIARQLDLPDSTIRRWAKEGGVVYGDPLSVQRGANPITRRCRNKWCIERFVPVNPQHWFHEPACRSSGELWTEDEILREEGSLEAGTHPMELARRAFGQKNQALRKVSALTSLREYLSYEVRSYYDEHPEMRFPVPALAPIHEGEKDEREVILVCSDWQIGKLENGIGVEVMEQERLPRIMQAARQIVGHFRDSGYPINRARVTFAGDMLEGCQIYAGQNVTGLDRTGNTHRLTRQIPMVARLQASVVNDLAGYVDEVCADVVGGNHGRANGRNDFADPEDNFDVMAGVWASDLTANNPRIKWTINEDWWGGYHSLGHYVAFFHGDQWRGPLHKIEGLLPQWLVNDVFKERPKLVLTGHRHDFAVLRVGGITVCQNGTIDGGSKWYLKAYGKASTPTQALIVMSRKRGPEAIYPIYFQ